MQYPQKQQGMVLIVTMVLMLILTSIATFSMQSSTVQEKIAGNSRDSAAAFQAAESAIRVAETFLKGSNLPAFSGQDGLYEICEAWDQRDVCLSPDWKNRQSTGWQAADNQLNEVALAPEYIIEQYTSSFNPDTSLDADQIEEKNDYYLITARGYGVSSNSIVVIQTAYRR